MTRLRTSRPEAPDRSSRRGVGRPGDGEDVRGAILSAALRQLESTGSPDTVTVAAILDEAGCTPPALYHYWPKRELLLREASAQGWAQFRASQGGAAAEQSDPLERLRSRGQAYLRFALDRPALFTVLFLQPGIQPVATGPTQPTADPGEGLSDLVGDVVAAMAAGALRPADPFITALALWSAMHGVAALWTVTANLPPDLAHAVGDLAQDAVLSGLSVRPGV